MFNSNFPVIDTLNILLHNCDHDPNNLLIALKKGKSLVRSTQFLILSFPKKKFPYSTRVVVWWQMINENCHKLKVSWSGSQYSL